MFNRKLEKKIARIRRSLLTRADGRSCGKWCKQDGGPGSGNWGHKGRPGEVGGSKEGGGKHNRQTKKSGEFTSFTKHRVEAAKMHELSGNELEAILATPTDHELRIVDEAGNHFKREFDNYFMCLETGEVKMFSTGEKVKVIVPNTMNPNYTVTREDKEAMTMNKDRAKKAFTTDDRKKADDLFRPQSGEIYKQCTDDEKESFAFYTGAGYKPLNKAIREGDTSNSKYNGHAKRLSEVLDKSELQQDAILHRGIDGKAAERLFGLPKGYLSSPDAGRISLVGRVGTEDAFMSCGAAKGTGFSKGVNLEIMAPKGIKGLYVEPFSACGQGAHKGWDGESKQDYISGECEVLLNRGCTLQIIGHTMNGSIHTLQVAIIRQDASTSEYSKKLAAKKKKKPPKKAA